MLIIQISGNYYRALICAFSESCMNCSKVRRSNSDKISFTRTSGDRLSITVHSSSWWFMILTFRPYLALISSNRCTNGHVCRKVFSRFTGAQIRFRTCDSTRPARSALLTLTNGQAAFGAAKPPHRVKRSISGRDNVLDRLYMSHKKTRPESRV